MLINLQDYSGILAYVVSDVHLHNNPYATTDASIEDSPFQKAFCQFLVSLSEQAERSASLKQKVVLILNGDILDITGSWFESLMPWDDDCIAVEKVLLQIIAQIFIYNVQTLEALQQFIEKPNTELLYIFGNHDGLLERYPASHQYIREKIGTSPDAQSRIQFSASLACEALDLYVEHGHRFDPYNGGSRFDPVLGDVVNILIVNRFVGMTIERLKQHGYSEHFIQTIQAQLRNIEYLRPLSLLPVWIQKVANKAPPDHERKTVTLSFDKLLKKVLSDTLLDSNMTNLATRQLHIPKALFRLTIKLIIRLPSTLPLVSFVASKLTRKTHSNHTQYRKALKIAHYTGLRLIVFGHTHIPGVKPLGSNAYFFNTGSWKPVINLFKTSDADLVELEYLHPDVQFNKIERYGILKIEKQCFSKPAIFSLTTLEQGNS
jgi:UDP-2,3-diacylglucosamine pyrophosphatase LpxH